MQRESEMLLLLVLGRVATRNICSKSSRSWDRTLDSIMSIYGFSQRSLY